MGKTRVSKKQLEPVSTIKIKLRLGQKQETNSSPQKCSCDFTRSQEIKRECWIKEAKR
jgi:hypothetical protein